MINNDGTYNLIKEGLNVSSLRGKVIANNMANINTKEYKKFNVQYEETFKQQGNLDIRKTKEKHMGIGKEEGTISVTRDESTSMRTDGNNVDLDLEKVNQAANTLMYNALITQANNKFNQTRYVITGGGR